jgi:predicted glycogen debranching enzyme
VITRKLEWRASEADIERLLGCEWLVTNGLGGYASGSVGFVPTRRYHGLLVAALPAPLGRMMMFNRLTDLIRLPTGEIVRLAGEERASEPVRIPGAERLREFRLEDGIPVWTYEIDGFLLEKLIFLPYMQNTVMVRYRVTEGTGRIRLKTQPAFHFRPHDGPVSSPLPQDISLVARGSRYEILADGGTPPLRFLLAGEASAFTHEECIITDVFYRTEHRRGYDSTGDLWSPGYFRVSIEKGRDAVLIASTEGWETMLALSPEEALSASRARRARLLERVGEEARSGAAAELVLAADQFIISPAGRIEDAARAHAAGDEVRTVIAGYHWFTDWGRDTMIGLEGLTLSTGRHLEARYILRTFAHYVKHGLIPNLFPEGEREGLYHTADASLWYFHAVERYLRRTGDLATLRLILPRLIEIAEHHLRGTRFGIGVDPADGLLRQGEEGYQLTWMDAKVDGWVVTPRRGKAVEINALWYNALRLLADWVEAEGDAERARDLQARAARVRVSFNERFWFPEGGYLRDVIDGEGGDDAACRPNQLLAISLTHPVLDQDRWESVLDVVRARLLTPVGLRSLAPGHPEYKPAYDGDLRSRDAAYHQGTVWAWLIGPFIDAWTKVHPGDRMGARRFLEGFVPHLSEACIGTISEIFDAGEPYTPRGCVAQAWSVAEVLRSWLATAPRGAPAETAEAILPGTP